MALEREWSAVPPQLFTADGNNLGQVQVADTRGFKVKAIAVVVCPSKETIRLQVKRIVSSTLMLVGAIGKPITDRSVDLTGYDVSLGAYIYADQQEKAKLSIDDMNYATYDQEPTTAWRNVLVDQLGRYYETSNPLPVQLSDGSINIGTVNAQLEMFITHLDNYPHPGDQHSSLRIGDGTFTVKVNPDGSLNVLTTDGTAALDIRIDVVNNLKYLGIAPPGSLTSDPVWKISRTQRLPANHSSGEDEITLVAGTGDYDQVWDDRVSLFPSVTPIEFWERRFERLLPMLSNANWLKLGNFDRVSPTFTDEYIQMDYFENGANIGRATVRYINDLDWQIDLKAFINDADGTILLDDDGTELNLD